MQLIHQGESLKLPDDLLWEDEFSWSPTVSEHSYALDGTLIVEQATKRAGRPISLVAPPNMAWVSRATLHKLHEWAGLKNTVFRLVFEYPNDKREFNVIFDHSSSEALGGSPVKGWPAHEQNDWFIAKMKLIEVAV